MNKLLFFFAELPSSKNEFASIDERCKDQNVSAQNMLDASDIVDDARNLDKQTTAFNDTIGSPNYLYVMGKFIDQMSKLNKLGPSEQNSIKTVERLMTKVFTKELNPTYMHHG